MIDVVTNIKDKYLGIRGHLVLQVDRDAIDKRVAVLRLNNSTKPFPLSGDK